MSSPRFLLVVLCALLGSSYSVPQPSDKQSSDGNFFNADLLNFYSPDSTGSRLDIFIEVPFTKIEFKKNKTGKGGYSSEIDFDVKVMRKDGELVLTRDFKEEVITEKTDIEYLSRNSQILTWNLYLEPGDYTVKISSKEKSSKKIFETEKAVTMRDFRLSPVMISDVMAVGKVTESKGRKYITPLPSRNAGNLDTTYLFFFVYLNKDAASLRVDCSILDPKNEEVFQTGDSQVSPVFDNQFILPVPTNMLANDVYKIKIEALTPGGSASAYSSIEYKWSNFRISLDKIELAIDQLQYIATDSEIKKIRSGKTKAEQQKRFMEFWKSKDPSPNTVRNEVMDEYYKRIEYANKNYSTKYTQGWKTDMGMVYIIFGLPDNVERHPYEMDSKPYEVWDYYDLNRQFVFVDESGFGDYHLVTPIWENFRFNY